MTDRISIQLGELHVSKEPLIIQTVLGSCIGVILWDTITHVGGMAHFVIGKKPNNRKPSNYYGDVALQNLLQKMISLGASQKNLKAKIYGGAHIFKHLSSGLKISQENIEEAINFLNDQKIEIVDQDIGGNDPREIIFCTIDFSVIVNKTESFVKK